MHSASETKKLKAAIKRLKIYIIIWGVAIFFAFLHNFYNLLQLNSADVLRLFSLLFFLLSAEGIYFRYYWRSKLGYNNSIFSEPKIDEVHTWQGGMAVMFGMFYALLACVLMILSFGK